MTGSSRGSRPSNAALLISATPSQKEAFESQLESVQAAARSSLEEHEAKRTQGETAALERRLDRNSSRSHLGRCGTARR